jgi:rare lipoprotein A (peptidoglycan hydrolase)
VIVGADHYPVRRVLGVAAPLAVAAAVLAAAPGAGAAAEPARDLPRLEAELDAVTQRAQALAAALDEAAARNSGLRVELDRLAEVQDRAQAQVDARVRHVYMRVGRDPLAELVGGLAAGTLRPLAEAELARRGAAAAVRTERELYEAAARSSQAAQALSAQAAQFRERLRVEAAAVLAAQDTARSLLAEAERAVAEQEARQARQARQAAVARAAADAERARLAASRAALDAVSATVTRALTPAQSRRSRNAAAREAPVLAAVEAAGSGYPSGWGPSGQVLRGVASWYGPGFVGSPTASGTPYDPERLTCAHKTLPLGTVVRVTRGSAAISCLVNDRGPYVGDRILDLSRAGSRALGFDGVAAVVVEVLATRGLRG